MSSKHYVGMVITYMGRLLQLAWFLLLISHAGLVFDKRPNFIRFEHILRPWVCWLAASDAMVFDGHFIISSQGMANPIFGTKDTLEVGVIGEMDSAEVKHFSFVPIGCAPETGNTWNFR